MNFTARERTKIIQYQEPTTQEKDTPQPFDLRFQAAIQRESVIKGTKQTLSLEYLL